MRNGLIYLLLNFTLLFFYFDKADGVNCMAGENDSKFDSVVFESEEDNECSPRFDLFVPKVKGIKINAPDEVEAIFDPVTKTVAPSTRLPVCISMQFPLKDMVRVDLPLNMISIVMVNKISGKAFSTNLTNPHPVRPSPKNILPPEQLEGAVRRYYYNVNISQYLKLPAHPATYILYATFQEFKSNVLTIQVVDGSKLKGKH